MGEQPRQPNPNVPPPVLFKNESIGILGGNIRFANLNMTVTHPEPVQIPEGLPVNASYTNTSVGFQESQVVVTNQANITIGTSPAHPAHAQQEPEEQRQENAADAEAADPPENGKGIREEPQQMPEDYFYEDEDEDMESPPR